MAALPGFTIDMALPALTNTAVSLGVPTHSAGLTISSFMISFGISPLVYGPMSDRYGRKLMVMRSTLGISIFTALMAVAGNPWRPTALELTAAARLQAGDKKGALDLYKSLADDLAAPRSLRARAAEMAAALAS